MDTTAEKGEHFHSVREIPRLPKHLPLQDDHGVGSKHKTTPQSGGDIHGLEIGIGHDQVARRKPS